MKRTLFVVLFVFLTVLIISACAPAPAPTAAVAPTTAPAPTTAAPTKISFWHAMGGNKGQAITEMTKRFNDSQKACVVEAIYQGSYDDELNKLKAGLQAKDIPAAIQMFDVATQVMVDLNVTTPVQDFIDKEKYDITDLEPNVLAYYTVNGKLYSMPFNTSNPILYYNKDAFKAAGLDPNKPPRTFADVMDYATKLTKKGADGKVTMSGYSMAIYGWFFEQLLADSGGLYLNNGNGRDARATQATFNSPEAVKILTWWKQGVDAGVFGNYGRNTDDTDLAFNGQQTAMMLESSGDLTGLMDSAKGKFELGMGFLPRPDEAAFTKFGTVIGGASVWILKDRPVAEQQCAWEFVKSVASPEIQAYWHTVTGYYPVRKAAYNVQIDKDWVAKFPLFTVAEDQLHMAPNIRQTQGALTAVLPSARARTELMVEQVLTGKATIQQALDNAAADATKMITDYEKTVVTK